MLAIRSHEVMLAGLPDSQAHLRKVHHRLSEVVEVVGEDVERDVSDNPQITDQQIARLQRYNWPSNVRELAEVDYGSVSMVLQRFGRRRQQDPQLARCLRQAEALLSNV